MGGPLRNLFLPTLGRSQPCTEGAGSALPTPSPQEAVIGIGGSLEYPQFHCPEREAMPCPWPAPPAPHGLLEPWAPRAEQRPLGKAPRRAPAHGPAVIFRPVGAELSVEVLSLQRCGGLCPSHWDWGLPLGRCDVAPPHCVCDWREFDRPILCFSRHGPPVCNPYHPRCRA